MDNKEQLVKEILESNINSDSKLKIISEILREKEKEYVYIPTYPSAPLYPSYPTYNPYEVTCKLTTS